MRIQVSTCCAGALREIRIVTSTICVELKLTPFHGHLIVQYRGLLTSPPNSVASKLEVGSFRSVELLSFTRTRSGSRDRANHVAGRCCGLYAKSAVPHVHHAS